MQKLNCYEYLMNFKRLFLFCIWRPTIFLVITFNVCPGFISGVKLGMTYPFPIVGHTRARTRALEALHAP